MRRVERPRRPRRSGPSKHAEEVSRAGFQALMEAEQVSVRERAELLLQACRNLGVADPEQIRAALRLNGIDPDTVDLDLPVYADPVHPVEGYA